MKVLTLLLAVTLFFSPAPPAKPPARPPPPLPSLPSISRVRVEAAKDRLVIVEELNLPRGEWSSGDLDLYVAFGAPGLPQAFEARLLAVEDGALEASADDAGEPVAYDRAARKPASAQLLLGRPNMAGAVLHVREPAFRRAVSQGNMASIRLRTLLATPDEDAITGREVVIRLGIEGAGPLTLGRLQVASLEPRPWLTRVEAHLCGAEADPAPLAILLSPRSLAPRTANVVAPVLSVRHPSDDLCIRFWN